MDDLSPDPNAEHDRAEPEAMSEPLGQARAAARPEAAPAFAGAGDAARSKPPRLMAGTSWWRRNFADNFSLEYELDAKIDRLRIVLATLPDDAAPAMGPALRHALEQQLQAASGMLADGGPFERVMQRINFVEAEIMMRLSDDRLGLALEALRAEASISLPDAPAKLMLDEIDKIAAAPDEATAKKVRLLGLKARLGATVIELFRGSERARDATLILGLALIVLTLFLDGLFYLQKDLPRALFTHYGMKAYVVATGTDSSPGATAGASAQAGGPEVSPPDARQPVEVIPTGPAALIDLAFPVILMAAAFGGIGACLSGLFSFTLQDRVPSEYEGYFRTLIRPMIGMASGFVAVFILRGGLFTFGEDLAWVAIVALVFGFSERLFMGTMSRLEGLPK